MAQKTRKSPTPSTAKKTGAELPMDTPKSSAPSLPLTEAKLELDVHQARMVAFLRERLDATNDEVLDFLVTAGPYAIQLDELAEHRVFDGIEHIYSGTEITTSIRNGLGEVGLDVRSDVIEFLGQHWRPRMMSGWRGGPEPASACGVMRSVEGP